VSKFTYFKTHRKGLTSKSEDIFTGFPAQLLGELLPIITLEATILPFGGKKRKMAILLKLKSCYCSKCWVNCETADLGDLCNLLQTRG